MSTPYPAIAEYKKERKNMEGYARNPNESNLRPLFLNLLNHGAYAGGQGLRVVDEETIDRSRKRPDGTLKSRLGVPMGYWESKGPNTRLDQEISKKVEVGYPIFNTLFENSQEAVLYQDRVEKKRVAFDDEEALDECLTLFVSYKREEVTRFESAIEQFKSDLPDLLSELRKKIEEERNPDFIGLRNALLEHCKRYINPAIGTSDVREMLIQHILTAKIFEGIFKDPDFHREHHLAREMNRLQKKLFGGQLRKEYLKGIGYYYDALEATAGYVDEADKQDFLKNMYEEFYKAYNPAAADRLGIVYTPTEVVRFIVRNADDLLKEHFGQGISGENISILDPATGTGTFICELIEQMDEYKLAQKYKRELHANEVSLLAYYVANLNIEYAYKQKTGTYLAFEGLCFVDTLDLDMVVDHKGKQVKVPAGVSEENVRRVEEQQKTPIHLIIGNPPYNAAQRNENENNKNREYPEVDKRVKTTFIKESTAQKTKLYDMYARFYRWSMDRLGDGGMLAFITNRSFIDAGSFDGFRRVVERDFDYAYIVDLGGDIRAKGRAAGSNVFNIMTGVAIMFLVKKSKREENAPPCEIHYYAYPSTDNKATKLKNLNEDSWENLPFRPITPDAEANWLNLSTSDFSTLPIPVADKKTKRQKPGHEEHERALFKLYTPGVVTARDHWVYDRSRQRLKKKMQHSIAEIRKFLKERDNSYPTTIKWSEALKNNFHSPNKSPEDFDGAYVVKSVFRPFTVLHYYADKYWSDRLTSNHTAIFGQRLNKKNTCICFSGANSAKPFQVFAVDKIPSLDILEKTQCLPFYRYDADGRRVHNITKWGLGQFRERYAKSVTPAQIFAYTYAVLHAPTYRERYAIDLKRHHPRLPFYDAFFELADWGERLLGLHTGYEDAEPYALVREDEEDAYPLPRLRRSRREPDCIEIDTATLLRGIPAAAWDYRLGTRSAMEWVLDQYKEKKEELPPIEGLVPYRLADHKEEAIELLRKVCTVSCETVRIIQKINQLTHPKA